MYTLYDECMNEMNVTNLIIINWMDEWKNELMMMEGRGEWMNERMNEWVNEWQQAGK